MLDLMEVRADASRIRLARQALIPRELSFPRLELVVPLGTLLVVGLTVGLIFLREFTDQRVKSASDLAILPGVRIAGMIPDLCEDPTKVDAAEMVVRRHPHSVLAESYRQALASLTKSMDLAGHQTLLVMGGLPGSGTTSVVTNLGAPLERVKLPTDDQGRLIAGNLVVEDIDLTLPGRKPRIGRKHPLTQTADQIKRIFSRMGFTVAEGPGAATVRGCDTGSTSLGSKAAAWPD